MAYVWSAADQTKIATLKGHGGGVYSAAFRPDGKQLATAGIDDCAILLWDLPPICHVRK
jgi:WD40 repeat protein